MVAPRLGGTCAIIFSLYLCCGWFWSGLYENERAVLLPTAAALGLWTSIRALLKAARPPDRLFPSIFFTLHLVNLVVVPLVSVLVLLGLLKASSWEWWK